MMHREDWNDDAYMDWADQERIVRQEVSEMEKQRRKRKAATYMEVEDGREMDHKHFGQEENALV